ncbi:MoaD/ThiS family protein [Streptomyces sp. NPDC091385]|uniref:MoaD/ThiS family protein n=1 Tax=Streptomyces sp. NPDC091385 TaxID=3365997 RepID=UPI003821E4CC
METQTAPAGIIRYWAAAKGAAGTAEEPYRATTLAQALEQARARHADRPRFGQVLGICSFLVDGRPVGDRDHTSIALPEGGTVEVLPPFAGG